MRLLDLKTDLLPVDAPDLVKGKFGVVDPTQMWDPLAPTPHTAPTPPQSAAPEYLPPFLISLHALASRCGSMDAS